MQRRRESAVTHRVIYEVRVRVRVRASRCVRVCADAECVGEGWGEGWARAVLVAGAGDDEHDVVHAADDTHEGGRLVLLLVELLRRPAAAS